MDRIEDCISFVIGKAAQQVTRRARELLAPFGVTPVQYAVLKVVCDADALSGVDIGKRMVLDSASITGVLDRLESLGLIVRKPNPDDRRAQVITASDNARQLLPRLDREMDRLNEEAAAILETDRERIFRDLRHLGDNGKWNQDV
ncbi:MAG: MarR family transcriptional regulator [Rhodobiaceae bacterium]|nr:MarR family transcriptional regulator [Rhodobiaceae bacterium]